MSPTPAPELHYTTIDELAGRLERREISPVEVTEAILTRIERVDAHLRAYMTVTAELALEQARAAERELLAGAYRGPLHGVPLALKDNIATRGIRTTCGSLVNPDWLPTEDATVYRRLREAGAILLGKTALTEYAFGRHSGFPEPLNPWRHDRTSGSSSSGSGVSVAAGLAYGALGSDTGGSGRYPAHVNGIVGLKATYGRVSRHGVFPLSYSLDHVTPMARSVRDSAIILGAIAGYDARDEYSASSAVPDFGAQIGRGIEGLKIGFARGYTDEDVDPDVVAVTRAALATLERLGAEIEELRLPFVEQCVAIYTACAIPEAAEVHRENLRRAPDRFGEFARLRLQLASTIPATDYIHAQRVRKLMRAEFRQVFASFDVIVGPARASRAGNRDDADAAPGATVLPDGRKLETTSVAPEYSGIYNLTGLPAIVVPAGFSSEGTPLGIQIAGRWFDEPTILRVAHAFEQATDWHSHHPPDPLPGSNAS